MQVRIATFDAELHGISVVLLELRIVRAGPERG